MLPLNTEVSLMKEFRWIPELSERELVQRAEKRVESKASIPLLQKIQTLEEIRADLDNLQRILKQARKSGKPKRKRQ